METRIRCAQRLEVVTHEQIDAEQLLIHGPPTEDCSAAPGEDARRAGPGLLLVIEGGSRASFNGHGRAMQMTVCVNLEEPA